MRRLAVALAILALATVLAAPGFAVDEVFQQTYPLPAGGSFQLQNVNGSVQVSGWERDEVEVYAIKTAGDDPRDLQRVSIEVEARPKAVSVQTRYPKDDGVEVYVEYHIRVPKHVQLGQVVTVNGAVRVFGVDAAGSLGTVNGNVEVFDSAGPFSAHTTNGDVRLELRRLDPDSPLALETVNGSILLGLPPGAGANLEVHSINGDFRSEQPVTLDGALDSRAFHGRLGPGGAPVRIRTVNGGIRVVTLRPLV